MDIVLKCISLFVLAISIACLAVVIYLGYSTPNDQKCISNKHGLIKCGSFSDLFQEHIEHIIAKRYIELKQQDTERQQQHLKDNKVRIMSITDQSFLEAKPAAKLIGKKLHDGLNDHINAETVTVAEWDYERNINATNGFLRHGIRYRNGRLVVPVDGTYFVYSLIDFFESCEPSTGKPNVEDLQKPLKHAIYKFNILEKAETEIIANVQPHQISSNGFYNSYSSYVSSLAYLKAGDEISLKVSNVTYLIHLTDNNFGLNLI